MSTPDLVIGLLVWGSVLWAWLGVVLISAALREVSGNRR